MEGLEVSLSSVSSQDPIGAVGNILASVCVCVCIFLPHSRGTVSLCIPGTRSVDQANHKLHLPLSLECWD